MSDTVVAAVTRSVELKEATRDIVAHAFALGVTSGDRLPYYGSYRCNNYDCCC